MTFDRDAIDAEMRCGLRDSCLRADAAIRGLERAPATPAVALALAALRNYRAQMNALLVLIGEPAPVDFAPPR